MGLVIKNGLVEAEQSRDWRFMNELTSARYLSSDGFTYLPQNDPQRVMGLHLTLHAFIFVHASAASIFELRNGAQRWSDQRNLSSTGG